MPDLSFSIGPVRVSPPTVLAPLAGITNLPFRMMVKQKGCGLLCSEMVSANGLVYGSQKTRDMLARKEAETPLSIQLFGADPDSMAEAAQAVEAAGADILDINFGCSVKKVVKTGSGVALMRDLDRSEKILSAVRKAIAIPLTIKIRCGWEASGDQAMKLARIAEHCGVDALCYHPRTARQGFSGRADWSRIARLKKVLSIPLIGNGDILSSHDALRMMDETGCDGVMIGRAALSDPDIFRRTAQRLAGTEVTPPTLDNHMAVIRCFLEDSVAYHGEAVACTLMRSRLSFLVKGLPGAGSFRKQLSGISTRKEVSDLLDAFEEGLASEDGRKKFETSEWVVKTGT